MTEEEWKTKVETKEKSNKQKTEANLEAVNATVSIINLNANGLNTPIKKQRLSGSKYKTQLYVVYKNPL